MKALVHNIFWIVWTYTFCIIGLNASNNDTMPTGNGLAPQDAISGGCHWSTWLPWSTCDADCSLNNGAGRRSRYRRCYDDDDNIVSIICCDDPFMGDTLVNDEVTRTIGRKHYDHGRRKKRYEFIIAEDSPLDLDFMDSQYQSCYQSGCQGGTWGAWTEFSECSSSCGNGVQSRHRHCKDLPHNPRGSGGPHCTGNSQEYRNCSKGSCPVDGGWSQWTQLGDCSRSCGNGVYVNVRHCNSPAPRYGGLNCSGDSQSFSACTKGQCQTDGDWNTWSAFSLCSRTCGNGVQLRMRQCSNLAPQNGGRDCPGKHEEFRACSQEPCPIDGGWSTWSDYGVCSSTCGNGVQFRQRQCNNPIPQHGGLDCVGELHEFKECTIGSCRLDGEWSAWVESSCSVSCGNGVQFKMRQCNHPPPQNGGLYCSGSSQELKDCTKGHCPIDGGWSEFKPLSCSATCGVGVLTSVRTCTNPVPEYGGKNCNGDALNFTYCHVRDCAVDGGWTNWNDWSACPVSSGSGFETRTRSCTNPAPKYGGDNCIGDTKESLNCVVNIWSGWSLWNNCSVTCGMGTRARSRMCISGNDCTGDSTQHANCTLSICPQIIDGLWSTWSSWSDCSATCGNGTHFRGRLCDNPPPQNGGLDCPGQNVEKRGCFQKNCPIDGYWGTWSNWTDCSQSCGTGSQTRTRLCDNPHPLYGGQICKGNFNAIKDCLTKQCPIDGGWSEFKNRTCSVTCGQGQLIALRNCDNPTPTFGGKDCDGLSHEILNCSMPSCAIDGKWSTWSDFSDCNTKCGDGHTLRSRTCSNPAPQNGGNNCTGDSEQKLMCDNGPCPAQVVGKRYLQ